MYTTIREQLPGRDKATAPSSSGRRWLPRVSPTVYFLGLVSLLTDISSEMVSSILPLYLVLGLGFSPLQFGVIDGLYHGVSALVKLAGGYSADRWRRYKEVAALGYGMSALAKIGLVAAGGAWGAIAVVIAFDRTGKGIRTAPRDALVSLSTPREDLGTAFGVHRAMDTFGALLGPIIAFSLLAFLPQRFDVLFYVSFLFALLGVLALVLFVENREPGTEPTATKPKVTLRDAGRLLREPSFRSLTVIAALLAVMTVSDGFLYLVVHQRSGLPMGVFPMLFVATALVYMILAVPAGRLADRFGRGRVLFVGYTLLVAVYVLLMLPGSGGAAELALFLLLFGAYYAATDGVLMALASGLLSAPLRASGLALLTTGTAAARLSSSILFGALWAGVGQQPAMAVFMVGMAFSLAAAAILLRRMPAQPSAAPA
jgi:MFS family permease